MKDRFLLDPRLTIEIVETMRDGQDKAFLTEDRSTCLKSAETMTDIFSLK